MLRDLARVVLLVVGVQLLAVHIAGTAGENGWWLGAIGGSCLGCYFILGSTEGRRNA